MESHLQIKKIVITKLVGAGILTTFGLSAWGGNQFFIIPIGIFFLSLPFLRKDHIFDMDNPIVHSSHNYYFFWF